MAQDPTQRAFALFNEWIELSAEQRHRNLDALRQQDPATYAALERLFAADDAEVTQPTDTGARLAQWAAQLAPTDTATPTLEAGHQLGTWQLLTLLGQGGMGSVWLGERKGEGFAQRAAIKLITLGLSTTSARDRFVRERGILAQLEHPNIAGLIDGGLSAAGQPYFAMTYVEGETIDTWCNTHRLDVRARVRLFLQVLDAVQYAHRNLVIHRDLKPSNVMVDTEGHVKLLDFGIAKLLESNIPQEATRDTAMTPQYAAPEQLLGQPVTTASDIYQLGLMLHALLVGGHPFGITAHTPLADLIHTLERPHRSLDQAARTASEETLKQRGSDRAALIRSVSGDLAAIVGTCLAREPERRYPSVDALTRDLQRWLDGQQVSVRAASRSYRLRFFLRRYRWAVAAALAIILSLATGLGIALQQMKQARLQAQRAEQVKNLILSVFHEQDPLMRGGNIALTPAQVVASGIKNLTPQQLSDTRLRGDLLNDLGEIQATLGDLAGGRHTLLDALAARMRTFGKDSQEVQATNRKLAQIALSMGNREEANMYAQRVLHAAERIQKPHSTEAARARVLLALNQYGSNQHEAALPLLEQGIKDLRNALGPSAPETIEAMLRHAQTLQQLRRDDEAIAELHEIVTLIETHHGHDSARLVTPLAALGSALRQAHQDEAADAIYARTVALAQRHFPGRNKLLASPLWRYGALKLQRKQYAQAQQLFDQAEQAMPDDAQAELTQLLLNRGRLHLLQHRPDLGEQDLRHAYEIQKQVSGENNGITWYYASEWAQGLAAQGRLTQAEQVQRKALARLQTIMGKDAYQASLILDALAGTLMQAQKPTEAAEVMRQSLALTAKKYPSEHPVYQERLQHLQEAEQAASLH